MPSGPMPCPPAHRGQVSGLPAVLGEVPDSRRRRGLRIRWWGGSWPASGGPPWSICGRPGASTGAGLAGPDRDHRTAGAASVRREKRQSLNAVRSAPSSGRRSGASKNLAGLLELHDSDIGALAARAVAGMAGDERSVELVQRNEIKAATDHSLIMRSPVFVPEAWARIVIEGPAQPIWIRRSGGAPAMIGGCRAPPERGGPKPDRGDQYQR